MTELKEKWRAGCTTPRTSVEHYQPIPKAMCSGCGVVIVVL